MIIWLLVLVGIAVAIASEVWVAAVVVGAWVAVSLAAFGLWKLLTSEKGPSLSWLLGLLFIVAVAGAASVFELLSEGRTGPDACARKEYKNPVSPGSGSRKHPRPIPTGADGAEEADPELNFQFGHTDSAIIRRQSFTAERAGAEKFGFTLLADVTDEETGNDLPLGTIKGKVAGVSVLRGGVRVSVCIDPEPKGEPRINPGTYEGSVAVGTKNAPRRALTSVPITVTVADDRDLIAMAAVLIGVIAGLVVRTAGDLAQATGRRARNGEGGERVPLEPDPKIAGLVVRPAGDLSQATGRRAGSDEVDERVPLLDPDPRDYFFSLRFLVMLAGGLIGGLLVYGPVFADNPEATVDLFDSLVPLAAAAFTATLAAKTLADLKAPTLDEREKGISGAPLSVREQKARQQGPEGQQKAPKPDAEGPVSQSSAT